MDYSNNYPQEISLLLAFAVALKAGVYKLITARRRIFGFGRRVSREAFGWNGWRDVRSVLRNTLQGPRVRAPGVSLFLCRVICHRRRPSVDALAGVQRRDANGGARRDWGSNQIPKSAGLRLSTLGNAIPRSCTCAAVSSNRIGIMSTKFCGKPARDREILCFDPWQRP